MMNRLYQKNELHFALLWIGVYVVSLSLADAASASIGLEKSVTTALCLVMTAFLFIWMKKQDLLTTYGLAHFDGCVRPWYQYLPLLLLVSTNLWGGVAWKFSMVETLLYIISMLCVGFLEEVIFRGFLFRALCKENIKTAIIVSSLTFGVGHIVNLLNGAELLPTLMQIIYATAAGFLFTAIVYCWGSLWPCIITHSVINSLSAIAGERSSALNLAGTVFLTALSLAYAAWIWKSTKKNR